MSKTASKSMHNWRRYPSSNWYEIDYKNTSKFGAVVAPVKHKSDKNSNNMQHGDNCKYFL